MTRYDVIVIGGGVNGLVAAASLARAGRRVLVAERRPALGGLCVTEEFAPGFRANTCVDDPGWLPPAIAAELKLGAHGYAPSMSPVATTIPTDNGAPILVSGDLRATAAALKGRAPRDAANWEKFSTLVARLAGFLEALYTVRAPLLESNAPADLLTGLTLARRLRGLGRRGMIDLLRTVPMPVGDLLDEWFDDELLKGALAVSGVWNVQHGPMSGGTALVFLHQHVGLATGELTGRRVVRGGVGALPTALAAAVAAAGGEIRVNAGVASVTTSNERVTGVVLESGEEIAAGAVVSSADPGRTLSLLDAGLFDPEYLHAIDHVRTRGPQVRVHLALAGLPRFGRTGAPWSTEALRGAITLAPTIPYIERAYDAAKHGGVAGAPLLRATIPSLDDPSFAPAGQHVLSAQLQFAAHTPREGWTPAMRDRLSEWTIARLSELAPGFADLVLHREVLTPSDVEARYGVSGGSLLHGELALDQFLFMRPVPPSARYATPVEGLWLCGSGTHPGAGTAGASGRLAAREVLAARRK